MPAARNQEVTVRRPRANKAPTISKASRGAERGSSTPTRQEIQEDNGAGSLENSMAGSFADDRILVYPYRVRGAGNCPPDRLHQDSTTSRKRTHWRYENIEIRGKYRWYAKDKKHLKISPLYLKRKNPEDDPKFNTLVSPNWEMKRIKDVEEDELQNLLSQGWKWARVNYPLVSQDENDRSIDFEFNGKPFKCGRNRHWTYDPEKGMERLAKANRIFDGGGESLGGVVFWDDWPFVSLSNVWNDFHGDPSPIYVVQTNYKVVQRCLLMTTEPGDLVIDPTCGSGTTAFVAEHWGRRWIAMDLSRVPLAITRQRLLTATYPWYELQSDLRGPISGFIYKRKQNNKGEETGGIVPQITLTTIANNEQPEEKVLVDKPNVKKGITRVSGPFHVEAYIPPSIEWEGAEIANDSDSLDKDDGRFPDRMLEVLRKSPVLHLDGKRTVTFEQILPPTKSMTLSAEAVLRNGEAKPVAFVFGPENGPVSERLVQEAIKEANMKGYSQLYVIGFAINPEARLLVEQSSQFMDIGTTYVQATPDLLMGDLLKNMRSSQIFSVCGLPEVEVKKVKKNGKNGNGKYQVSLLGLDVFDPATLEVIHRRGDDVPAWFLDTNYNGLCFNISQAFFPRTSAWDNIRKALKGTFDESVWDHLAGTISAPFEPGDHKQIAVKVLDDRGNELMVVKPLNGGK
jgi:adenine-specific DNA-methyltransferase